MKQNESGNTADVRGVDSSAYQKAQNVKPSTIEENKKYVLDGMGKNQHLALPVDEPAINSPYGYRTDPISGKRKFHRGVDMKADFNCVYSVMPGKVVKSGRNRELGEFVQVEHGEFMTTYGHLFQRLVNAKEAVEAGQVLGISGSSGRSTGEHLHFAMSFKGKSIDPMPILNYIRQLNLKQ
jgi:murein DD-endopeptidase MepM/ murein hydrolase activator NlpD